MNKDILESEMTHIPMTFRARAGKTVIVLPDGSRGVVRRGATIDNSMVKLIVRGFRWQRMLYEGKFTSIEDLSAAEKINPSYVSRVLRLAFLSPKVVQAIIDGKQPAWLTMKDLLRPHPNDWSEQEKILLCNSNKLIARAN
jgi:hypothetical protein